VPVKDSQVREMVMEYLRRPDSERGNAIDFHRGGPRGILEMCRQRIPEFVAADEERLYEIFYELSLERIIVPLASTTAYQWPYYRLTKHGRAVVQDSGDLTYDPHGYVQRIRGRVPQINETVTFYLEQAVTCFSYRLLPAAAVMLGCAAEKLILDLVDAFIAALANQKEQENMKKELEKAHHISQAYAILWKRLEPKRKQFPHSLQENLEERPATVFYQVRKVRNDSGHPTGYRPEEDEVHGNLLLFSAYAELTCGLIGHLKAHTLE
jgi:hypothetical protein